MDQAPSEQQVEHGVGDAARKPHEIVGEGLARPPELLLQGEVCLFEGAREGEQYYVGQLQVREVLERFVREYVSLAVEKRGGGIGRCRVDELEGRGDILIGGSFGWRCL